MAISFTISLPDWSACGDWLQTPVMTDSAVLYWHVLAVIAYLVITYVSALIGVIRSNFSSDSSDTVFWLTLFPLTGAAAFVAAVIVATVWLLWWPLSLPLRLYERLSGGKQ
jgi:Flp pilus assembly pilin Flp